MGVELTENKMLELNEPDQKIIKKQFKNRLANQLQNCQSTPFISKVQINIDDRKKENNKEEDDEFHRRIGLLFFKVYVYKPLRNLLILYTLRAWYTAEKQGLYNKYELELTDDMIGGENESQQIKLEFGQFCSHLIQMHIVNKLRFCKKFAFQLDKLPNIDIKPVTRW